MTTGDPRQHVQALLTRAAAGDAEALSSLLEQDGPAVRTYVATQLPPRWQAVLSADDVMQQTYIDAFLDVSQFDPEGSGTFAAWLTTLAKRNMVDAIRMLEADKRGAGRRQVLDRTTDGSIWQLWSQLAQSRSTPSRHAARNEARQFLERAIADLPAAYRTVVEMYDLQGHPVADVAAALDRTPGAVFMLRSRAHRLLRKNMGTASLYLSDSR